MILTDMPFLCLLWSTLGVVLVVIAIFMLAREVSHKEANPTNEVQTSHQEIEELFNYFLEEEEKKNEGLRALIKSSNEALHKEETHPKPNGKETDIGKIIHLYEEGLDEEAIAKKLKKGIGEVKLIISLYKKR